MLPLSLFRSTGHVVVAMYSTQEHVNKFRKFIVLEEQYGDYSALNSTVTLYSTNGYSILYSIFLHGRKN